MEETYNWEADMQGCTRSTSSVPRDHRHFISFREYPRLVVSGETGEMIVAPLYVRVLYRGVECFPDDLPDEQVWARQYEQCN